MIRRLLLPLAACLALSGCASLGGLGDILTPQRCEDGIRAAQTVEQIIGLLEGFGLSHDTASKIADGLAQGQVSFQAACDFARTQASQPDPSTSELSFTGGTIHYVPAR